MKKFIVYSAFLLLLIGCAAKKKQMREVIVPTPLTCVTVVGVTDDAPPCKRVRLKDGREVQKCDDVLLDSKCLVVPKK